MTLLNNFCFGLGFTNISSQLISTWKCVWKNMYKKEFIKTFLYIGIKYIVYVYNTHYKNTIIPIR